MAANVWRVFASEGQQVRDGETLLILESMKMEIPLLAECDGVVLKVQVAEGDSVKEGDVLVVLK